MKQINGTAFNIEADILGRITLKGKSIFNRKNEILVKADAKGVVIHNGRKTIKK